jgi:hypothetical protein
LWGLVSLNGCQSIITTLTVFVRSHHSCLLIVVLINFHPKGGDNRGGVSVLSRTAIVSVNGGTPVSIRQRSGSSGIILSQPLNVTFNAGGENTLTFAGFNGGT